MNNSIKANQALEALETIIESLQAQNRYLLAALEAALGPLSGHHEALGHDYEVEGLASGPCVGCEAIEQARAAIASVEGILSGSAEAAQDYKVLILLLMLGVAGAISEWIAPTIQRQIAESWTV